MTGPLIALVEGGREAGETFAALLYIELGLTVVIGRSTGELVRELGGRRPDLLMVGSDQNEMGGGIGAVAMLDELFPNVPSIAIGRHKSSRGADEIVDEPVDAIELLALVRAAIDQRCEC